MFYSRRTARAHSFRQPNITSDDIRHSDKDSGDNDQTMWPWFSSVRCARQIYILSKIETYIQKYEICLMLIIWNRLVVVVEQPPLRPPGTSRRTHGHPEELPSLFCGNANLSMPKGIDPRGWIHSPPSARPPKPRTGRDELQSPGAPALPSGRVDLRTETVFIGKKAQVVS